jgi:TonB family protein
MPSLLFAPAPHYPRRLKQAGASGTVLIEAVLDTAGRLDRDCVRVTASPNAGFNEEAMRSVVKAVYRPARHHGKAVRVLVELRVQFDPARSRTEMVYVEPLDSLRQWPGLFVDSAFARDHGCVPDSIGAWAHRLPALRDRAQEAVPEPGWESCLVLAALGMPNNTTVVSSMEERREVWRYDVHGTQRYVTIRRYEGRVPENRGRWVVTDVVW